MFPALKTPGPGWSHLFTIGDRDTGTGPGGLTCDCHRAETIKRELQTKPISHQDKDEVHREQIFGFLELKTTTFGINGHLFQRCGAFSQGCPYVLIPYMSQVHPMFLQRRVARKKVMIEKGYFV
jgi:hypothetical protein